MAMAMTGDQIRDEAKLLDRAEGTATQIRQTTSVYPQATMDDAYRIQDAWLGLRLARGERLVGHKIGLTSRAMQTAMNITTPDSGFLTDAMVVKPDSELAVDRFCDPKLEIELAFVLGRDLTGSGPDGKVTVDDVMAATDHVTPAAELIDARSHRRDPETGRTRTVVDTIADNAADAAIVCGGQRISPTADLRWVGAVGYRNDIIEETGLAAGVLDHPANGIVWLAERYRMRGRRLEAGQSILAGSFTRPINVHPGDRFRFDFGPHGSFGLRFAAP
jgi:2-oxo-hept-3-ene-1,7-dioate hydratase